jgi:Helix-turn-helix domain
MTWQRARAVLDLEGIDPTAKFVLIAVALRAGTDGRAWPSVARVCRDTGLGDRAVRMAIKRLAKAGHLDVLHRPGATLTMTVGAASGAGPGAAPNAGTAASERENRGTSCREKSKEELHEVAAAGSTAKRPAAASNGKGTGTEVVIHNGPAPGESWGEYRERGGR